MQIVIFKIPLFSKWLLRLKYENKLARLLYNSSYKNDYFTQHKGMCPSINVTNFRNHALDFSMIHFQGVTSYILIWRSHLKCLAYMDSILRSYKGVYNYKGQFINISVAKSFNLKNIFNFFLFVKFVCLKHNYGIANKSIIIHPNSP